MEFPNLVIAIFESYCVPILVYCFLLHSFVKAEQGAQKFIWNRMTVEEDTVAFSKFSYIFPYFMCAWIHRSLLGPLPIINIMLSFLLSGFFIVFFGNRLYKEMKQFFIVLSAPIWKERLAVRLKMVIGMWFSIFILCASINYILYIIFPAQYEVNISISEPWHIALVAFEFVYYTFMLMITYSGDGNIVPSGVISKSLQMIEIIVFFVFVGILINQFLDRANNLDDTGK